MTLRARVLAGSVLVAVLLGIAVVVVTRSISGYLVEQVDDQLRDVGGPAAALGDGDGDGPFGGPGPRGGAGRQLSDLYVAVVRADATLVEVRTPDLGRELPSPVVDVDALRAAPGGGPVTATSADGEVRYRVVVQELRDGLVVVGLPLEDVDAAVARLLRVELVVTAAALLVVGLVAFWVVRLGVRPVKEMTAAASAIAAGEPDQRVPEADERTEAGRLGQALNQMLGRIEGAFAERTESEARLRRFVADASHELRTPVTTIRGYAELYRAGGLRPGDDLDEAMRRTGEEARRMGSLVDDLLLLARLDQGRPLERDPVDLARIAVDAARDASAVAPDRDVSAVVDGPLVVTGDEGRLRQVVANLVGNALVHTPPGSPLELVVRRDGGRAVVEVVDHGDGMPVEVRERAFERFYRADPSRSRHKGGNGLGLSIVRSTVEAHGGTASIHATAGGGATVRLELPAAPAVDGDRP